MVNESSSENQSFNFKFKEKEQILGKFLFLRDFFLSEFIIIHTYCHGKGSSNKHIDINFYLICYIFHTTQCIRFLYEINYTLCRCEHVNIVYNMCRYHCTFLVVGE